MKLWQYLLRRLLFVVPPRNQWASPLYELAMMTDSWLREKSVRPYVDMTFTTCEAAWHERFRAAASG